ncbi:MAG: hypothetical protein JSS49_30505 [Planctomycetes bacterium]|nr:hypothetical protein [Planctomycetota bacterium]
MSVIAPSAEACQALVDRINSGSGIAYTLTTPATYTYVLDEDIKDTANIGVIVVHDRERTLNESLDLQQRTSHDVRIVVQQKLTNTSATTIDALRLLLRQLYERVYGFQSADQRVTVWECDEPDEETDRATVVGPRVFQQGIELRVEVEPPA